MFEPTPDQVSALNLLVDDWMPSLRFVHLRLAIFLIRHGYIGERGMAIDELERFAKRIQLEAKSVSDPLREMVQTGMVLSWYDAMAEERRYALNPRWRVTR